MPQVIEYRWNEKTKRVEGWNSSSLLELLEELEPKLRQSLVSTVDLTRWREDNGKTGRFAWFGEVYVKVSGGWISPYGKGIRMRFRTLAAALKTWRCPETALHNLLRYILPPC